MPLPKRKTSKSARDQRRTHWKLTAPNLINCPRCHAPKLQHNACPSCGFYGALKVMDVKEEAASK